jgi:hypothetical protein
VIVGIAPMGQTHPRELGAAVRGVLRREA